MKRLAIITLLALAGCSGQPEQSTVLTKDFTVERLFTHEGCTVYRFSDGGYSRYFTNCQGSTSWTSRSSNGKSSSTTHHEIKTEVTQ